MAINKVVYGNNTLIDLTSDTVAADNLLEGYTAHDKTGALITGTASGGGGEGYKINVTAPIGSLIVATQNQIAITNSIGESGVCELIVPNIGTWTITATLGEDTATKDIFVNDYEIELEYFSGLWIYNDGVSVFTFNNGVSLDSRDNSPKQVIFGENSIQVDAYQYDSSYFSTKQTVDFSLYNIFYMIYECDGVEYTKSVSVSNINGQFYLGIQRWRYSGISLKYNTLETGNYTLVSPALMLSNDVNLKKPVYIKKMWLE